MSIDTVFIFKPTSETSQAGTYLDSNQKGDKDRVNLTQPQPQPLMHLGLHINQLCFPVRIGPLYCDLR